MKKDLVHSADRWIDNSGPMDNIVISGRIRYARNLADRIYAPYAKADELKVVSSEIDRAISASSLFAEYEHITITDLSSLQRLFLKESRLISAEMEKGGECREVYLSKDRSVSIMINEEDHIRMQHLEPGFQLGRALEHLNHIDDYFSGALEYAFSSRWGHLTTCPTNTGTGFRASVMIHLPALALNNETESVLKMIQPFGLTARGFYGENSEFLGDFYQISNAVSLGKSEEEILDMLGRVVTQIMEKEKHMREKLFTSKLSQVEDAVWRSYALLSNARMINSTEAMHLLSRLRLGIDKKMFPSLTHTNLNKLIINIQPAHLQFKYGGSFDAEKRDVVRAELLRKSLQGIISDN